MTSSMRQHWGLRPDLVFLNHGSFGACPKAVLAQQQAFREQMEADPVTFMVAKLARLHEESREALASFVGVAPEDLVLVPNATTGVNAVLRSLDWRPGEQILLTNHAYNACANAVRYVAQVHQLEVVIADVPFPLEGLDAETANQRICDAVMACVTPRTRLALLDHITSATAVVMPIRALAERLAAAGVETLIDGAHAPGMVPLSIAELGVTYYTGNAHKWLCAPKGTAFLWVTPARQEVIRPTVISHGANEPAHRHSRFTTEFDWTGTFDPTGWCCLPFLLGWMETLLEGGWPAIMEHNRSLVLEGRRLVCDQLGLESPVPDELIGSIAVIPLPDLETDGPVTSTHLDPLLERLYNRYSIQVPIYYWPRPPKRWLRLSAYLYNTIDEYQTLANALAESL
jgi:isopenicillin-N epimerase